MLDTIIMGVPLSLLLILAGTIGTSIFVDFFGHKDGHEMNLKEATKWSIFWIGLAGVFYFILLMFYSAEWASLFLSGYVLEKSLSIDNLMVFTPIMLAFGVTTAQAQHKVLLWGLAGALVFRGVFVAAGSFLFDLHWIVQVAFALLIIWSAKVIMMPPPEDDVDFENHKICNWVRKVVPVTNGFVGDKLFTTVTNVLHVTPLFLCIAVIEASDIMFSFDSVPAVIGVTKEPVLIYAAMIFAICGLRALYFVLAELIKYLVHLDKAVGGVLVFVGIKMIAAAAGYHVDPTISLFIILGALGLGVAASFAFPEEKEGN